MISLWRGEVAGPVPAAPTMREIVRQVADERGVTVEELKGRGRTPRVALARFEAIHRVRQVRKANGQARYSTTLVGQYLNRDHTSIVYAERRWAEIQAAAK